MERLHFLLEAVRPLHETNDPGHDLSHALRVAKLSETIAAVEGGDLNIILPAALCHDIRRWEHAADSESMAQLLTDLLINVGYSPGEVDAIILAVKRHSFRAPEPPQSLEEKILFDADKLEALGATGIGRCFAVSGKLNQPIFETGSNGVTAHSLLKSLMAEYWARLHTETARSLGRERFQFALKYIGQLESELRLTADTETLLLSAPSTPSSEKS